MDKTKENDFAGNGGYISKLIFNNGQIVDINENDIVVFVGPNNVGKSQSLKDIYELCESKKPSTVVADVEIVKYNDSLEEYLNSVSDINDHGEYKDYSGLGYMFNSYSILDYKSDKYYGSARSLFVACLNTLNRLTISDPAPMIPRKATKNHPIHYAAFDRKYRVWLAENFKKAFGKELIPYTLNGANIPLCIGDKVQFNKNFEDEQTRQEEYAAVLDTYRQVRRFTEEDAEEVSKLVVRNFLEVNSKDYGIAAMEKLAKVYDSGKVLNIANYAHMYVFEWNGKIVGTGSISSFWGSKTESILLTIFVLPELHGKGIGREIINTLEQDEFYVRATRIEIPASITATEFYRKFGYDYKNGVKELDEEHHYRLEKFKEAGQ